MQMKEKLKILLIIAIALITSTSYGQENEISKNSIKLGIGSGVSSGEKLEGFGFVYSFGYQRAIWNNRLKLNPNFSIGKFSAKHVNDAPDQYFNSINLEANVYIDIIKLDDFSFVFAFGGLANKLSGLQSVTSELEGNTIFENNYINEFHVGGSVAGGIRLKSRNRKTSINIMPINVHFGNNYFSEIFAKIELDFTI